MAEGKGLMAPKVVAGLLIQAFLPFCFAYAQRQLTPAQAEELLLNMPAAIEAKEKRGCPSAQLLWRYERQGSLVFSMHDPCSKSGPDVSDLMGIYAVDIKRGEVWLGAERLRDRSNVIDSPRLKELRNGFLGPKRVR
jgi:hypothetical protein